MYEVRDSSALDQKLVSQNLNEVVSGGGPKIQRETVEAQVLMQPKYNFLGLVDMRASKRYVPLRRGSTKDLGHLVDDHDKHFEL